ncbi:hypothetical protein [Actinomadura sp. NTSP31]|uniref:hypothetical protein n=1 Tax=Actinomadura sp. NTSP31 TaxID=1735447 RepID=UPI0035BFAF4C
MAYGVEGSDGYEGVRILCADDGTERFWRQNDDRDLWRPLDLLQMRLHPGGQIWGGMWGAWFEPGEAYIPAMEPGNLLDKAAHILAGRTGPQWREAADTALLSWPASGRRNTVHGGMGWLRAQIHQAHRQLTPIWRRKSGHQRVLLLDTPFGESGATLHDLVSGSPPPDELALGAVPDDPRLAAVLDALTRQERMVVLAWAHWQPNTWAEAAMLARATDPVAYGERVRRKLKRLGNQHAQRAAAARSTAEGRA